MLLLAAFAFSQCKGMNTIDKKQSERSAKYNKLNSSPVVSSTKSTPSKDLVSPSSHLHKSNSTSKHHTLPRHHSNSKKRRHISSDEDDVWTEHISSSGRIYYYNRKTDESQWEKPKGYVKKLKFDSHSKGETKLHSKPSDSHSKPLDSHFKSVDSHSKSTDFHSKSSDYHSDRKHGHQGGAPNKYHHRDHRHGNSEHRSSNTHRLSTTHDKKSSEHNTIGSNREFQQTYKPSRTPQKVSTGSESCSPLQDVSIPCSSPMVQQHQQLPQPLCPMTLKPIIPCQHQQQQQQHEHQNYPPAQPPQFMSPQQHQPPFMSKGTSNGPPLEGGMVGAYRPWPPGHLPPMHAREQGGAFPSAVSPLLPAVFSPGGGPPGRGEHLAPHPAMSMDNLSQGLHPLQQAFLLQNQQHHHSQMITPVNTPGGTPITTPCKPLLPELSLPPLPSKNTPHTPSIHPHSNPGTPHLHKNVGGTVPYQLFSEQKSRPPFDRTHSVPASSKDLMEQFQNESKSNLSISNDPQANSGDINDSGRDSEAQEAEQQKIQIGMDYFNKPLTEFWITPAYESMEKQLCQSSVDSLTHKHIEGRRLSIVAKRFSMHSNAKQLRSFAVLKK